MGKQDKPARDKLLPDFPVYMLGPGGRAPPTLVLGLEDTLVHITWDQRHGFRVAKRPGVDKFLQHVSQFYEVVVFSSLPLSTGEEILNALDRDQLIAARLFQECTCREGNEYKKDLSFLNRDLGKTVVV